MKGGQAPPYPVRPCLSESESQTGITPVDAEDVEMHAPSVFLTNPMEVCCPYCRKMMETRVVYSIGAITWLSCGVLCLMGCLAGCCLIPFCIDTLQDADHYCSNCSSHIGTYKIL